MENTNIEINITESPSKDNNKVSDIDDVSNKSIYSNKNVRFNPESLHKMNESHLSVDDRTELISYRSFTEVKEMMNNKFGYKEGNLSTTLDIISIYLKGQKILYLEAKSHCEFYLHRLMMPSIFLASLCSVASGIFNEVPLSAKIVSAATAFNAFLMSLISYFKLDARAEAHKMTAYSFDQLISECEFTSGKILLSNTDLENVNHVNNKNAKTYDLVYVQNFINEMEKKVKEIKEKNQFIIPDVIRNRYPSIYNTNIFSLVKNTQIDELIEINKLKVVYNECSEAENKIIKGLRTPEAYNDYREKYIKKNEYIEKILNHRKTIINFNGKLMEEIENKNVKRSCCKLFY